MLVQGVLRGATKSIATPAPELFTALFEERRQGLRKDGDSAHLG